MESNWAIAETKSSTPYSFPRVHPVESRTVVNNQAVLHPNLEHRSLD
jgi:hypothetical protein